MKYIDSVFIAYDFNEATINLIKLNKNGDITQKRKMNSYELTPLYEILKQMKGEK